MTQKTAYYVAAIFFAIAAVASFIAGATTTGIAGVVLSIVFGIFGSRSKVSSTL